MHMSIDFIYPEFEIERKNEMRCTNCRICEKQCANGVHRYDSERHLMISEDAKCVNCQRCVCFCPDSSRKSEKVILYSAKMIFGKNKQ